MDNRTWVAFANENECNHRKAIKELGYISWTMKQKANFAVGDTVFLFMSDDRSVRFKMKVTATNVDREDSKFWNDTAPHDKTYHLEFVSEYKGDLLKEDKLYEYGYNGGTSLENPNYSKYALNAYINSVFNGEKFRFFPYRFMVVDLNSGAYTHNRTGHEIFNLVPNEEDGRFYGYCPPLDNPNIVQLGASKHDEFVDNVMVIYVEKIKDSSDRKIIAFIDNARVYKEKQENQDLNRYIVENGKTIYCSYTIESDYLYDLKDEVQPFVIHLNEYSGSMFRKQRFYSGKYPELDKEIIKYLTDYISKKEQTEDIDDLNFQAEVQTVDDTTDTHLTDTYKREPSYSDSQKGRAVSKNSRISKQALKAADFKCQYDESHITFDTTKGVPYMEGHHLIPCTFTNSDYYWKYYHSNIDCEENIVCLCPTCHRRIHFGSCEEKQAIIADLYEKQIDKLKRAGLDISLEDLLNLYNK